MEQVSGDLAPRPRATRYVVAGSIVVVTIAGLITWALARPGSTSFYMTVAEVQALGPTGPAEDYRVNGNVVDGSVRRDGLVTSFEITDGTGRIAVTTDQPLPDAFYSETDRVEVVALGDYDGFRFVASEVLAKCPSKFKAKA